MNCFIRTMCAVAVGLTVAHGFAQTPTVSNVTMSQDQSRKVTITYALDMPAVVTLDIETNVTGTAEWVSIGGENIRDVIGDVNKLVRTADSHTILWQPDRSWPNHRIPNNGARAVVKAWAPNAPPDWMLIDLNGASNVTYYATVEQLPYGHPTNATYKSERILMRKIPAAGKTFRMGITYGESMQDFATGFSSWNDFKGFYTTAPAHLVSFTEDFYMSIYQLTQDQYRNVQGTSRSLADHNSRKLQPYGECPVTGFSVDQLRGTPTPDHYDWPKHDHEVKDDSVFGEIRKYTGVDVDLPTEAQWEYACRAGEGRYRYDGAATCTEIGDDDIFWHNVTDIFEVPVGQKRPNAWDMYDMYGNGYQWCLDYFVSGYTGCGTLDPTGPQTGNAEGQRSARGNLASTDVRYASSALRYKAAHGWTHVYMTFRMTAPAIAK